jgi:transposase
VVERWVDDELWALIEPLIPPQPRRRQGGGMRRADERKMFAVTLFVLVTGSSWRDAGAVFGVWPGTAHRAFARWTAHGVWPRLHRVVLDRLGAQGLIDWSRAVLDSASVRAEKGDPRPVPVPLTAARPDRKSTS